MNAPTDVRAGFDAMYYWNVGVPGWYSDPQGNLQGKRIVLLLLFDAR